MKENRKKRANVPNLRFPGFVGEWSEKKLFQITSKIGSGKTPKGGEEVYTRDGVPFIRSQNVINDSLKLDTTHIPQDIHESMNSSKVLPNDILLNITGGSIGRSCVVPNNFIEGNVNQHVSIIRLKKDNPKFLQPILSSWRGQRLVFQGMTGSGREGLNFESIKSFKICFPSIEEQNKVASFLQTIEERISTQNKIIEEYKLLKNGMMQKFFKQEIRYKNEPGNEFSNWDVKKLAEVFQFMRGSSLSKIDMTSDGNNKCIHYGELFTKYKEVIVNVDSHTNIEGVRSQKGDILMPSSDVTPVGLATASVILEDDVILGGDINILRPKVDTNSVFVSYMLNFSKNKIIALVTGTTVKHIYNKDIKNLNFNFPSVIEQQKIASTLSAIDKKIELETAFLDKLNSQKQYCLQNLFI